MVVKKYLKSMHSKWKRGEITHAEYADYLAQKRGYKDQKDYLNHQARNRGCIDASDEIKQRLYRYGIHKPMSENKECSLFLGVHIAERILSKIFENVNRMPFSNPGFDFICGKGYKIDVKSSSLIQVRRKNDAWYFHIDRNNVADYFLLVGFDNRNDLNPMHIWLIGGSESITGIKRRRTKMLCERKSFVITNTERKISELEKYECKDRLEKLKTCCETLRQVT